jgi:ParB family chromosome partitioning protein
MASTTKTIEASAEPDTGQPLELVYVPPGSLLLDRNVRLHADDALVESIRLHGVLQPIVAVKTAAGGDDGDGELRVKFGHRRTVGAIAAQRPLVPVLIAGDEADDDPGQIDRVLEQLAENEDRAALTALDHVNAIEQLAAFALPAGEIAKRTRRPIAQVEAALKVAQSPEAKDVLLDQPDLDLVSAAAVAEFDGDDRDAAIAIVTGQVPGYGGSVAHRLQRLRDDAAARRARAAAEEVARGLGFNVIDKDTTVYRRLDQLSASVTDRPNPIDPVAHEECPGHAVFVTWDYGPVLASTLTPVNPDGPVLGAVSVNEKNRQQEVNRCSVCGCTEDNACMVQETGVDGDGEPEMFEEPCDWSDAVDPLNPEAPVCTACVGEDGEVIEARRKKVDVVDVSLPGDEPAEEPLRGQWLTVEPVCTEWEQRHVSMYDYSGGQTSQAKKKADDMTDAERAAAKAERKDVIDSNKAWPSAEKVRRAWVKQWLTRKTTPKGTGEFLLASQLGYDARLIQEADADQVLADWLGAKSSVGSPGRQEKELLKLAGQASEARALVLALGVLLAKHEAKTVVNDWRNPQASTQRYLGFLAANGYELSEVEQRALNGGKK